MKIKITRKKLLLLLITTLFIMPAVDGLTSLIVYFNPYTVDPGSLSTIALDTLYFTVGWFLYSVPFLVIFSIIGLKNFKSKSITIKFLKIVDFSSFLITIILLLIIGTFIFDIITRLSSFTFFYLLGYSLTLFPIICCYSIFIENKLKKRTINT